VRFYVLADKQESGDLVLHGITTDANVLGAWMRTDGHVYTETADYIPTDLGHGFTEWWGIGDLCDAIE
jgi:hypothetical protein